MKIGILTLVPYDNYGGILQGYALQTVLERMGHDVTIMNTKLYNYVPAKVRFKQQVRWLIEHFIQHRNDIPAFSPYHLDKWQDYRVSALKPFIKKYVHLTRTFSNGVEDIANFAVQENYDAFVVGSDQTWRPCLSPDLYHMFCDFLPAESKKIRIAYAASFGVDRNPYNDEQLKICKQLIHRFNAVAVREESGIKLCKELFDIDAKLVLDPTMLLDKEDYLKLIEGYQPVNKNVDLMQYVFFFQHDESAIIEKVGGAVLGMKPVNLMTEKFLHEIKDKSELPKAKFYPIEEWIYAYSQAKFVITDSFHGTVFCLILNVPFLVVSPETSGRQKSLLNMFGLSDRLVMTKEEVTPELVYKSINWDQVNRKREELKQKSLQYLRDNLGNN